MRHAILPSVLALAALGATATAPAPAEPSGMVAPASAAGTTGRQAGVVGVRGSRYGRILTDGRGYTLYLFTRDRRGKSRCYGACAKAWPPLLVKGRPRATTGARRSLLGTTRRSDGTTQVTYRGWPLYYYVGERSPLQVLCQNVPEFGGTWLVVSPRGTAIR